MGVVLLIARLFLALIFGIAGIAKAVDPKGSRQALVGFGMPERVASTLARVLPFVEVLVALALVPLNTAWWGAIAALALLLTFIVGIGVNLARGRSPDCHCFGQLHSKPVSWSTFARNLALAALAGFIAVQGKNDPGLSALDWLNDLRTAEAINLIVGLCLIGLVTATLLFLKRMLRQQAKLFDALGMLRTTIHDDGEPLPILRKEAIPPKEGLPIGTAAPSFSLATTSGGEVSLDGLLDNGKFVLLLFAGPSCWGCKVLLPAVRVWQQEYADLVTVAVLSTGTLEETRAKMARFDIDNLLLDKGSEVTDNYQAKWTPAAVLVSHDGKIASHLSYGDTTIREWLRNLISSGEVLSAGSNGKPGNGHIPQVAINYSVRRIGEPTPKFWLKDLYGKAVDIEDLQGSPTLLLFWHPDCGICKTMIDDLKRWEEHPPQGAPKLVFIACGEMDDARALNKRFKSPTLLDPAFDIGPLFGTRFTPSAILIDSEGRIASSLAMGADNVRALVGLPKAELPAALEM